MRILYWANGFWPRIGGIETLSIHFIELMQQRGYEFQVLAQQDPPSLPADEIYRGMRINRFDFNAILYTRLAQLPLFEKYLQHIKTTFKPDLIHVHTIWGGSAFAFLLFEKIFNIPVIFTAHDFCLYDGKPSTYAGKIMQVADQVCCVSKSVLQFLIQAFPFIANKSMCIHNGLPFPELKPEPLSFNPPTILCLGRLSPEKGFPVAIWALARLRSEFPELRLILAGDGDDRQKLLDLIESLSLTDRVNYVGPVSMTEVPALINKATMVVMPSLLEPFGLVAVEAGQMQRPIIVAATGGLPEVIIDNESGILIPPNDEFALCEAIRKLIHHPDLAISLGQNGRQRALEKFTIQTYTDNYEQVYLDVVRRSAVPAVRR